MKSPNRGVVFGLVIDDQAIVRNLKLLDAHNTRPVGSC